MPKVKKCLQVASYNPGTTYKLMLDDCYYSDDSGQFAYSFLQKGSKYYWVCFIGFQSFLAPVLTFVPSLAQPCLMALSSRATTLAAQTACTDTKAQLVALPPPRATPPSPVPLEPTSSPY